MGKAADYDKIGIRKLFVGLYIESEKHVFILIRIPEYRISNRNNISSSCGGLEKKSWSRDQL